MKKFLLLCVLLISSVSLSINLSDDEKSKDIFNKVENIKIIENELGEVGYEIGESIGAAVGGGIGYNACGAVCGGIASYASGKIIGNIVSSIEDTTVDILKKARENREKMEEEEKKRQEEIEKAMRRAGGHYTMKVPDSIKKLDKLLGIEVKITDEVNTEISENLEKIIDKIKIK